MAKTICWIQYTRKKRIKAERNGDKDGEVLQKINEKCCIQKKNRKRKI